MRKACFLIALLLSGPAQANCFAFAGGEYNHHPDVLRAIAWVESGWDNKAVNRNTNGSEDVCQMQINSFWLDHLEDSGITRQGLLDNPCLCVRVGAYVLAYEVASVGNTWLAVGQYHRGPSGSKKQKLAYAAKVRRVFEQLQD